MAGKVWWEENEAARHVVLTVRKQGVENEVFCSITSSDSVQHSSPLESTTYTLRVSSPSVGKLFWKPSQTCQETYLYGYSKSSQVGNGDQPSKHPR